MVINATRFAVCQSASKATGRSCERPVLSAQALQAKEYAIFAPEKNPNQTIVVCNRISGIGFEIGMVYLSIATCTYEYILLQSLLAIGMVQPGKHKHREIVENGFSG